MKKLWFTKVRLFVSAAELEGCSEHCYSDQEFSYFKAGCVSSWVMPTSSSADAALGLNHPVYLVSGSGHYCFSWQMYSVFKVSVSFYDTVPSPELTVVQSDHLSCRCITLSPELSFGQ